MSEKFNNCPIYSYIVKWGKKILRNKLKLYYILLSLLKMTFIKLIFIMLLQGYLIYPSEFRLYNSMKWLSLIHRNKFDFRTDINRGIQ